MFEKAKQKKKDLEPCPVCGYDNSPYMKAGQVDHSACVATLLAKILEVLEGNAR